MAKVQFWERSRKVHMSLALAAALVYVAAFVPLHGLAGVEAGALVSVPVALVAWAMGFRAGVVAGLLGLALNAALLRAWGGHDWDVMLGSGGPATGALVLVSGGLVGRLGDVHRRMKEDLGHRQGLEVAGQMAAGVAHEVRNALSVIQGFSQLLLARQLEEGTRKEIQVVFDEARRAVGVIQDLLSFARRDQPIETVVDVAQVIGRVQALKAYDFQVNGIRTELRLGPDIPLVMANEGQLQQVFFNIMTNAQQAMVDYHSGGSLVISGERVGGKLKLSFADNGPGIAPGDLRRIFDPFFTTKGAEKGTGLGLSVSSDIVASHGGQIWAESEVGRGATFFVELPGM